MKIVKGTWGVIRKCCRSGMCIECQAAATGRPRKIVAQTWGLDEASAKTVAENFSGYEAQAVPMDSQAFKRALWHPAKVES